MQMWSVVYYQLHYTVCPCPFSYPTVTHRFDRVLEDCDSEELSRLGPNTSRPTP